LLNIQLGIPIFIVILGDYDGCVGVAAGQSEKQMMETTT
jgi:hypothetical protein